MNEPDDFIQVKRGRPKKFSEEARRRFQLTLQTTVSTNTRHYADLQKTFIKENYSQKLRNIISSIPTIVTLPCKILQLPLQNFLEESVKQLMISDIELVAFSIILQRVNLNMVEISAEELLKLCFYLAKAAFETNTEVMKGIHDSYRTQYKNFESDLLRITPDLTFTVAELNKRYKELDNFMYTNINYSYYVDDIVRLSPPYQISDKKAEKKEESEVKEDVVPRRQRSLDRKPESAQPEELIIAPPPLPDYHTLMPLEDHEDYINSPDVQTQRRGKHPFDFLNHHSPSLDEDEDLEMLLHF